MCSPFHLLKHSLIPMVDALSKLLVADAEYISVTKNQCFETTRTGVREFVTELLNHHNGRFIWLRGSPGTGKTAIAKSIADSLARDNRLAASFFWDKTGGRANANTIELFPSTLASQLAIYSRDYEGLLVNRLLDRSSRNVLRLPLEKQMDLLIIDPMSSIRQVFSSVGGRPVVVLDGLDECGDSDMLVRLMKLVLLLDRLPYDFMILVSARPEPEIRDAFGTSRDIPCVYTDKIRKDDTDHTIGEMVRDGLAEIGRSRHADWAPSEGDVLAFIKTCRQLPVLAEIRIREVKILARSLTFQRAFHCVKEDAALSKDLNDDYLRILRRAYSSVPHHVLSTYRDVVGTIIVVHEPLSARTISEILGTSEGDVLAVLDPIGSIINAPTLGPIHFYHATAKEFLSGPPQGDENDREFFFNDMKGAFLGLPLLRILNHNLRRNMANPVDSIPLGEGRRRYYPNTISKHTLYAVKHWSTHLDLSSASEELWGELRMFLTTKLLFWLELSMSHGWKEYNFEFASPPRGSLINHMADSQLQKVQARIGVQDNLRAVLKQQEVSINRISANDRITNSEILTSQWFVGVHSDMPRLINDVIGVFDSGMWSGPRHIYRSMLPFLPRSSPILVHYNELSDPIRVLRVRSRNNKFNVPRLDAPPIITCTALSDDGRRVALGFHDGVVEVVDTELGTTIQRFANGLPEPPVWLLFINGGHKLVTETSKGDIYTYTWDNFTLHRQRFASRFDGSTTVVASLSRDGSRIVRAAQHFTKEWYENMYIIDVATDSPTIHSLSTPSHIIPYLGERRRFPLQRSVGFSPDGQYAAAFDMQQAFVWSCASFHVIAHYSIDDPRYWFLNTNRPLEMPTLALLNDAMIIPFPTYSGSIRSTSCILFNFDRRHLALLDGTLRIRMLSIAAAAAPVLGSRNNVWFRGHEITTIPDGYYISKWRSVELEYPDAPAHFSLPASRDGTRFLLLDKSSCPVLVDISGVINDHTT